MLSILKQDQREKFRGNRRRKKMYKCRLMNYWWVGNVTDENQGEKMIIHANIESETCLWFVMSACHIFPKWRKVTLPRSYRSTYSDADLIPSLSNYSDADLIPSLSTYSDADLINYTLHPYSVDFVRHKCFISFYLFI